MEYEHFDCEIDDYVAQIRMLGSGTTSLGEVCEEFVDLMLRLQEDRAVRAILVTDGEHAFDLAADLDALADERRGPAGFESVAAALEMGNRVVTMIREMAKPVVTATRGDIRAAGLGFFLTGDVRLAGSTATFTAPETTTGLMPDWGLTFTLPRLLGPSRTLEFLWSGRTLGAEEAWQTGLVDHLIADASWDDELAAFMTRLASLPQPMVRLTKLAAQQGDQFDMTSMLGYEFEAQQQCWESRETSEGLTALQEGRRPEFQAPLSDEAEE